MSKMCVFNTGADTPISVNPLQVRLVRHAAAAQTHIVFDPDHVVVLDLPYVQVANAINEALRQD